MKRKFFLLGVCTVFLAILVTNPYIALLILLAAVLFLISNHMAKKSAWWKSKIIDTSHFMPQPLFRADYRRNFSMLNLGSLEAKNDFQYGTVYGLNLSTGVQSLDVDEKILKFYHSYLSKDGFVAIVLSPYIYKHKEDFRYYSHFFKTLDKSDKGKYGDYFRSRIPLLDGSSYPSFKMMNIYIKYPLLLDFKDFFIFLYHRCLRVLMGGGKCRRFNQNATT